MRDFKLIYTDLQGFDIDIKNGQAVYVDEQGHTQDQRAAVGAAIIKGTIPGKRDLGVDWSQQLDRGVADTYVDMYNQASLMIQEVAGGDGQVNQGYIPLFLPEEDGTISLRVLRGTA